MRAFAKAKVLFLLSTLVILAFPAAGAVRAAEPEQPLTAPPKPCRFQLTIKSEGYDRVAHVQIPIGYKAGSKPPLVLMLHGAGGNGAGALDKDGWAVKADKEGFIVVAPDGLPAMPRVAPDFRTNPPLWNSGQLRSRSPRAAIDDVAYVRALLDELKEKAPYDERRVFCAGHSNGGAMTFRLASDLSERFAAVGSVAGMPPSEVAKPKKPLPMLYILGTKDPLMPIAGGEVKLPWATRENPPVAGLLETWAKTLGCETTPKTISDKDAIKRVEYPSKSGGPTLSVIYLEGHGHHWPGGKFTLPANLIGPTTSKFDATDALWEFFRTCGDGAK